MIRWELIEACKAVAVEIIRPRLYNPVLDTPPSVPIPFSNVANQRAFWFAAVVTAVVFLAGIYAPLFIVDSWSYLELSKTVFTDFYRFNTLRQFESLSPYSNTFPPLWPVLLAVTRQVLDLGIYTGYLLNCVICIGLLAALMRLFSRLGLPGWAGAACYLSFLGFVPFLWDALGAKTLALSLTLLTCTLLILFGKSLTFPHIALAGLLMGLACLNRFDALLMAGVVGLAIAIRVYRPERHLWKGIAALVLYSVILGGVLSPWMVYGKSHFGQALPSDNTRQVMRVGGGNVLDYYQIPPPSDFVQTPVRWLVDLVKDKAARVARGLFDNTLHSVIPVLFAVVLVAWIATRPASVPAPVVGFAGLTLVLIPVILLPQTLVGYSDSRYYSGPVLLLLGVLFAVLVSLRREFWKPIRIDALLLVATLPLWPSMVHPLFHNRGDVFTPRHAMVPLSPLPEMRQLTDAVHRDASGQPHRLMLTTGQIESVKYGALTGEPTIVAPRLVGGTFAQFARDWHITHLYDPPQRPVTPYSLPPVGDPAAIMNAVKTPGVELIPLDLPGLYRIRLTEVSAVLPRTPSGKADNWMYLGTYTSRGGNGVHLYSFDTATGRLEPAGVAAGRLWQSNADAPASSLPRILAQMRAEWPHPKMILSGVPDPTVLTLHPQGRYLYTADSTQAGTVSAFQRNPTTGKLTMLNTKPSGGGLPAFVRVDTSHTRIPLRYLLTIALQLSWTQDSMKPLYINSMQTKERSLPMTLRL